MKIFDLGFGIWDFEGPRGARSGQRQGVTILEVLFAILITTIGLLGAVAILPVASSQARRGRVNDDIAAAGRAAVNRVDAMGLRRPDRWIAYETNINRISPVQMLDDDTTNYNQNLHSPWLEFQAYMADPVNAGLSTTNRNWFGAIDSFCIDPRFIAHNTSVVTMGPAIVNHVAPTARRFPVGGIGAADGDVAMWRISMTRGPLITTDNVSVASGEVTPAGQRFFGGSAMSRVMADSLFVIDDDLAFIRGNDRSQPPNLPFNSFTGTTVASTRQSEGRFSWMATLVPERNNTSQVANDLYTLSLVIFQDRPADMTVSVPSGAINQVTMLNERVLNVASINGQLPQPPSMTLANGGGEFELTAVDVTIPGGLVVSGEQQLNIHRNDWICLAGRVLHQNVWTDPPPLAAAHPIYVPIFKWYRVTDCEPEATYITTSPPLPTPNNTPSPPYWRRYVSLSGQDWPLPVIDAAGRTCTWAIYVQGVVGVYEKSVRLEVGEAR